MIPVTLHFTEEQYQLLQRHAENTNVTVEQILQESAENKVVTILSQVPPMDALSDTEILQMALSKMDVVSQARLHDLQHQETRTLSEQQELAVLWDEYWVGQYTKTEAMIEASKRGLRDRSDILG